MYRTKVSYEAAYLIAVMEAEVPISDGRYFVFNDPTGALQWAGENYYRSDPSVTAFVSAIKKLKAVLRDSSNAKG